MMFISQDNTTKNDKINKNINLTENSDEEKVNHVSVIKLFNSNSGSHFSPNITTDQDYVKSNKISITHFVYNEITKGDLLNNKLNTCIWKAINNRIEIITDSNENKSKKFKISDEILAERILIKWYNKNNYKNKYYFKKRTRIIKNLQRKLIFKNIGIKPISLKYKKNMEFESNIKTNEDRQNNSENLFNKEFIIGNQSSSNLNICEATASKKYCSQQSFKCNHCKFTHTFNNKVSFHNNFTHKLYNCSQCKKKFHLLEYLEHFQLCNLNNNNDYQIILNNSYTENFNSDDIIFNEIKKNNESPKSLYAGFYKTKYVEQYMQRYFVNEKLVHRCKWKGCNFETQFSGALTQHIYVQHINLKNLKCCVINCGKMFKNPTTLAEHQRNHLCGFNLDSSNFNFSGSQCSSVNIKKFINRIKFIDVKKNFSICQWPNCKYKSIRTSCVKRHVHLKHICPNRAKSCTEIMSLIKSQFVNSF